MNSSLIQDAILRVGEVTEVNGRKIYITVDKNKNLSDLFYEGDILRNIAVNSYIEIRKGFLSIIGKVEGEKLIEDPSPENNSNFHHINRNMRILTVALSGYISENGDFIGGTKELPLLGNEAYIITKRRLHLIHNLLKDNDISINVAVAENEDFEVKFPADGLFNSHIAIFGNTGSGKSNTLASLYQNFFKALRARNSSTFDKEARFILFDFNGEYSGEKCISENKKVINLSTGRNPTEKIPLDQDSILDLEILSILSDATEKTQKPFLKRTLNLYRHIFDPNNSNPTDYFKNLLRKEITRVLQMSDKLRAFQLMDYTREILPQIVTPNGPVELDEDLDWNNTNNGYTVNETGAQYRQYLHTRGDLIPNTLVYQQIDNFQFENDLLNNIIKFLYLQLIRDLLSNRAQNEHIAPAINKLKSKRDDINKIFDTTNSTTFWSNNLVVINLNDVNLEMKKTIPLLISKKAYNDQKTSVLGKTLTIIIDEAHNILSKESFREAESWKDYRLETFEEIIKEGRKFGVFVTIASQRPNDISPTITSQAHNYFIHRLINEKDLTTIASAVSYIDKVTEESIPSLPTGTCIFSGTAGQMPLKLKFNELPDEVKPKSKTIQYKDFIPSS